MMKRKMTSPATSPNAPDPKRHSEEVCQTATNNAASTSFQTPIRPTQNDSVETPRPNRSMNRSLRSVASVASFKSIEEISSTTKNVAISDFDFGATRTGKMRDVIEVDVFLIDGNAYTAQIGEIESYKLIYRKALDLDAAIFYGIKNQWAGHPLVEFRLKEKIDIDKLPKTFFYNKPDFDIDGNEIQRKVTCEIRGVRTKDQERPPRKITPPEEETWPITRWVKIEGTGYDLPKGHLDKALDFFGSRISDMTVEAIEFVDSDSESEENKTVTIHTGNLSVKMKLDSDIPQFVPLFGRKIKIHYRGVVKSCTKCYRQGHMQKDCPNERVILIDYVEEFMAAYPLFPTELYGRWTRLVEVNKRAKQLSQANTTTNTSRK